MIPYGRQDITQDDVDAVVEVLRSDFLTQGPTVPRFEAAAADQVGVRHAVALGSATSALHVACLALDLGPGDVLWTTPNTFVASANCALYCGAKVDFVDIEPRTFNLSVEALAARLEDAEARGCLPKIVVPVHFAGEPPDMESISALATRYGFRIIEDASHAIGARYRGEPAGCCGFSDITVFSFHPVKIITTAEGGMALTNDAELAARMALLRSHGITRDSNRMVGVPEGDWYYQQIVLGFNYRMTEIQAALGLSQLSRLEAFVRRRHLLAARYDEMLESLPVVTQYHDRRSLSAMHLYVIRLRLEQIGRTRRNVYDALRSAGVGVNVHYIPVHTHPYYQGLGFRPGDFPESERYYSEALALPLYPTMTEQQQDQVVAALTEALRP